MTNFKFQKSAKLLLSLSVIVFLAAACNRAQAPVQQNQPQQQTENQQTAPADNQRQPANQAPPANKITVQQTVQGSSLNQPSYQVTQGESALDLLKATHQAQTKTFSGVGEFVEAIDGIKPDSKRFWAFYVNGQSSNVGASSYVLKNGDKIEWKLEVIK